MAVEYEPQPEEDDHDYGAGREQHAEEPEDLGLDLLARARLLCQAANEIALPMLRSVQQLQANKPSSPAKARKPARPSRPSTREEDEPSTSHARQKHKVEASKPGSRAKSRETPSGGKKMSKPLDVLPPIAAPAALPPTLPGGQKAKAPAKPTTQIKPKRKKEEEEEEPPLPQINATDEWRKQREAEKIRHAQERAKARVLRKTNHVDALPPTKSNQHAEDESTNRPDSSEASKDAALGQIEANRRRALERVKLRKLELAEEQARAAAAKQEVAVQQPSDELVKKTEAFRHRTLQRLQAAKLEALAQDSQSTEAEKVIQPQDDAEEKEKEWRRLAKQRRRETTERLKRQQQVAEEQQRKEQELFEKGLNEFKTKKKEQDRVAKGLAPKRPLTDPVDPIVVFDAEDPEPSSAEPLEPIPSSGLLGRQDQSAATAVITDISSSDDLDHDPSYEQGLSLTIPTTEVPHDTNNETHQAATDTVDSRPRPKKVPSWKQPPVPILPAECYAQKALVSPSDSYSERFQLRTGRASPTAIPEATFSPPHRAIRRSNNNE